MNEIDPRARIMQLQAVMVYQCPRGHLHREKEAALLCARAVAARAARAAERAQRRTNVIKRQEDKKIKELALVEYAAFLHEQGMAIRDVRRRIGPGARYYTHVLKHWWPRNRLSGLDWFLLRRIDLSGIAKPQ